jgi:hypothetical protein
MLVFGGGGQSNGLRPALPRWVEATLNEHKKKQVAGTDGGRSGRIYEPVEVDQ